MDKRKSLQTMNPRRLCIALALAGGLLLIGCADERSGSSNATSENQRGRGQMPGMMKQMMGNQLPPDISLEDLPESTGRGAMLTAEYCGSCHALPSPQMHAASEWPAIAKRMFRRMEMMSGMMMDRMSVEVPSAEERKAIVAYLQAHALQTIEIETLGPSASTEEKLFRETCAQCHALPDPTQHSAEEWPSVVARMQQNLEFMGREPMSAEEIRLITDYLQDQAGS